MMSRRLACGVGGLRAGSRRQLCGGPRGSTFSVPVRGRDSPRLEKKRKLLEVPRCPQSRRSGRRARRRRLAQERGAEPACERSGEGGTQVRICHDDEAVYFAIECAGTLGQTRAPKAAQRIPPTSFKATTSSYSSHPRRTRRYISLPADSRGPVLRRDGSPVARTTPH